MRLFRATRPAAPGDGSRTNAIPPLIKRNTAFFALAQMLQGSGNQLVTALGAVTVLALTDSALLTGVGVTMLQLSRIAISYPLGRVADAYGRRPAMLAGLFMGLSGAPILAVSVLWESLLLFMLGAFVFGLGVGATQQLRVAVTDMYPGSRRGEALGYLLTGSMVGSVAAPVLIFTSEGLADVFGIDKLAMPWLLTPVLIVPAVFAILAVRPDPREIATNLAAYWPGMTQTARAVVGKMSFAEFVKSRPRLTATICYLPAQGVMSMIMATTPLVLTTHGHSLTLISLSVTIHVFGMFAFAIPLGRLADRVGRTKVIWGGLAVSAGGALVMPVTELYGTITFGGFLVGVGWSATFVAATAILADTTPAEQRGRVIGINDMAAAMFTIALPLTGGFIAEQFGLMTVGVFGAILTLLPLPLLARLREPRPGVFESGVPAA